MSDARTTSGPAVNRERPPPPGPLRPFHFPPVVRHTLPNGLAVLVAEVRHFPVVTASMVMRAGGVFEAEETAGLAALTGDLLESGAGTRSGVEVAEAIETLGVQIDAGTSWEISHLDVTGLRSRLDAAADIFADLLLRPTFPQDEVERLRSERLAEIMQRRSDPRSLANEMAARFIFSDRSPYSRPLSGTAESVERLTRQDVQQFHATRFGSPGSTLVIAGDLSAEEAIELAERHFGDWGGGGSPWPTVVAAPRVEERRIVVVDRPGSVQSEIRVGHPGVPRATPDYFPLVVANTILGGAFTSRLNMNLRERHGFTYGVQSAFAMRREAGVFSVATAVQTEVTAAAVTEIFSEIEGMRSAEVTAAELEDARSYLAGVFPLRLQTTEGVAARLMEIAVHELPDDYYASYRERVLAVSAPEVLDAVRTHVRPEAAAIVVVGDAAAVRGPLEALGLGTVEVVSAEGLAIE